MYYMHNLLVGECWSHKTCPCVTSISVMYHKTSILGVLVHSVIYSAIGLRKVNSDTFSMGLSCYNTVCLVVNQIVQCVWKLPLSLHLKGWLCRFG